MPRYLIVTDAYYLREGGEKTGQDYIEGIMMLVEEDDGTLRHAKNADLIEIRSPVPWISRCLQPVRPGLMVKPLTTYSDCFYCLKHPRDQKPRSGEGQSSRWQGRSAKESHAGSWELCGIRSVRLVAYGFGRNSRCVGIVHARVGDGFDRMPVVSRLRHNRDDGTDSDPVYRCDRDLWRYYCRRRALHLPFCRRCHIIPHRGLAPVHRHPRVQF